MGSFLDFIWGFCILLQIILHLNDPSMFRILKSIVLKHLSLKVEARPRPSPDPGRPDTRRDWWIDAPSGLTLRLTI